jgi:hypothetical protein
MDFYIPHLVENILNSNANGTKVLVIEGPHEDGRSYNSNGDEVWEQCDGKNTYASANANICRGGSDPIDCFTFIEGDFDRYKLCGYCLDEVRRTIQWRIEVAVILFHLGFSKDIRQLLMSYIDIETPPSEFKKIN